MLYILYMLDILYAYIYIYYIHIATGRYQFWHLEEILHDLIGCKNIADEKNRKDKEQNQFLHQVFLKSGNLCRKQVVHSSSCTSNINKKVIAFFKTLFVKVNL